MEHRWGQRVRVDIPVQLEVPPARIVAGRILDLSVSGAWISGELEQHLSVEIAVVFEPALGSSSPHRIPAFVTRARLEGIGVEWRELAPPLINSLLGQGASAGATSSMPSELPSTP
ncbi:MAG: PilZ domain-containing protein [Steroidobacteraceae bacterium]|jgi:hypothetical protein